MSHFLQCFMGGDLMPVHPCRVHQNLFNFKHIGCDDLAQNLCFGAIQCVWSSPFEVDLVYLKNLYSVLQDNQISLEMELLYSS